MLRASIPLLLIFMIPPTVFVSAIGLVIGLGTARLLRTNAGGIVLDAALAGFAFWLAFFIALALPWHGAHVENGWTFTNQFPYPMAWALASRVLCPFCIRSTVSGVHDHTRPIPLELRGSIAGSQANSSRLANAVRLMLDVPEYAV